MNTCFAGRELYRKFQVDADTGFSQSHVAAENANYTLDQIVAMNSIKRTVEHLEHKLDKITDMWQDKERGVGEKLQLSDLETAMKTVTSLQTCTCMSSARPTNTRTSEFTSPFRQIAKIPRPCTCMYI